MILDQLADKFTIGDGCWEWTAYRNPKGYGILHVGGKRGRNVRGHRVLYELMMGRPIPEGLELDHLCSNRGCVRPDHLEPVTHAENIRRGRSGQPQVSRTECPHGHPYDEVNTRVLPNGRGRACRECARRASRASYRKAKGTP